MRCRRPRPTTPRQVYCNGLDPSVYSGYEIALFDRVRVRMGWETSAFNWTCMDWDEMCARRAGRRVEVEGGRLG